MKKSIKKNKTVKQIVYDYLKITKEDSDEDEEQEWLADQWDKAGFKSYIYARDLSLLKDIASDLEYKDYMYFLGRRKEILRLAVKAKEANHKRELEDKKINNNAP